MLLGQTLEYSRWFAFASLIIFIIIYLSRLLKNGDFQMTPTPLAEQPLFKAALLIPFISFLTFGFISWAGHSFQLDAEGLNNFIDISKLPLALLSLAVPFGVIVNNIHRTIQTNAQIKEAQIKNKNDLYYSHQKNTIEHIEKISVETLTIDKNLKVDGTTYENEEYLVAIKRPLKLYRKIFTKLSKDNFCLDIDREFTYTLTKSIARINNHFHKLMRLDKTNKKSYEIYSALYFSGIENELRNLAIYLGIDPIYRKFSSHIDYGTHILYSDLAESAELYCLLYLYFDVVDDLCTIINLKLKTSTSFVINLDKEELNFDSIFKSKTFKYVSGSWPIALSMKD